jgi:hypothetical protein
MLVTISISVVFIILDVLSVTKALKSALPVGINPFWKISFVFKCLTDAVVLDDFKTALDKIREFRLSTLAMTDDDERSIPGGSLAVGSKRIFGGSVSMRPWKELGSVAEGSVKSSHSHIEFDARNPV